MLLFSQENISDVDAGHIKKGTEKTKKGLGSYLRCDLLQRDCFTVGVIITAASRY